MCRLGKGRLGVTLHRSTNKKLRAKARVTLLRITTNRTEIDHEVPVIVNGGYTD